MKDKLWLQNSLWPFCGWGEVGIKNYSGVSLYKPITHNLSFIQKVDWEQLQSHQSNSEQIEQVAANWATWSNYWATSEQIEQLVSKVSNKWTKWVTSEQSEQLVSKVSNCCAKLATSESMYYS